MADDNAGNGEANTSDSNATAAERHSEAGSGQQAAQDRQSGELDSPQDQRRTRSRNADRQRPSNDDSDDSPPNDDGRRFTQADIDKAIEKRLARDRQKNGDVDAIKKERDDALAAQQQTMDNIAKALNLKKDDAPPDPAALAARVSELESERDKAFAERDQAHSQSAEQVRAKDIELAAYRAGAVAGANLGTLMDSRAFLAQISRFDPADDGFDKSMAAAVKAALESNPAYRITQTASPAQAGIGATGSADNAAAVSPGIGRLRAGYGTT